jgi:hypothetical protein
MVLVGCSCDHDEDDHLGNACTLCGCRGEWRIEDSPRGGEAIEQP